jgi:hypothetical protein
VKVETMRIRVAHLAAALSLLATPALAEIQINVDKTAQTLTVSRDGQVLHTWPVSTGRVGRFTPSGNFRAFRMEKDHYSKEFDDAPMPNSIFFTNRGHAIHGSFETRKLGRPASGGCVRLAPENAKVLFELVKAEGVLKTKVSVSGDERVAIARADRNLSRGDPRQAERGTGLPPTYSPREDDERVRQQYAAQPQQPAQPQQYFYDGYQWRPYAGSGYRATPQPNYAQRPAPYYGERGYAPQYYYQPRYGYGYD